MDPRQATYWWKSPERCHTATPSNNALDSWTAQACTLSNLLERAAGSTEPFPHCLHRKRCTCELVAESPSNSVVECSHMKAPASVLRPRAASRTRFFHTGWGQQEPGKESVPSCPLLQRAASIRPASGFSQALFNTSATTANARKNLQDKMLHAYTATTAGTIRLGFQGIQVSSKALTAASRRACCHAS